MSHIWMRAEARDTERRAPLTPQDAAMLVKRGCAVTVERSMRRVFPDAEYRSAGCAIAETGGWTAAPSDALILGVKELPPQPDTLAGRFAHFAHLYKDQRGWREEIARFQRGDATHYDLEYLTNENGRRVAAFGYWAGWLGAAIGLWGLLAIRAKERGPRDGVISQESRDALLGDIRVLATRSEAAPPRALVIGAGGRSGGGACDMLEETGCAVTRWDMAETADLDREALLSHDLLVNCVLMRGEGPRFVRPEDLRAPETRLAMISDVSCDPLSDFNPIPLYDAPTSWDAPFIDLGENGAGEAAHLTAIDNLPSLLPRESSVDFSAQLAPVLAGYPDAAPWRNAERAFRSALARA